MLPSFHHSISTFASIHLKCLRISHKLSEFLNIRWSWCELWYSLYLFLQPNKEKWKQKNFALKIHKNASLMIKYRLHSINCLSHAMKMMEGHENVLGGSIRNDLGNLLCRIFLFPKKLTSYRKSNMRINNKTRIFGAQFSNLFVAMQWKPNRNTKSTKEICYAWLKERIFGILEHLQTSRSFHWRDNNLWRLWKWI